ncbi:MAG: hypothetical protein ACOYM8_11055 [Caulobacterales bacterium]
MATITGVQAFFAWEFWGAVSDDPVHQLALRALGLGFVAGEVVALDMASRADLAEERKRATTLRTLWAVLAVSTFTADISALSRVLQDGDAARNAAIAAYEARQSQVTELARKIDQADDPYDNRLRSVVAYEAAINGKQREIGSARQDGAPGSQRRRLEAELTDLQAARAAAAEVAAWQSQRDALLADPASHAAKPQAGPVEFQPFAALATRFAQSIEQATGRPPTTEVTGEDVRTAMAWIATIAMKLMLTFGVWVGLQRTRASTDAFGRARDDLDATSGSDNPSDRRDAPPSPGSPLPSAVPQPPASAAPTRPRPRRLTSPVVFSRGGVQNGRVR